MNILSQIFNYFSQLQEEKETRRRNIATIQFKISQIKREIKNSNLTSEQLNSKIKQLAELEINRKALRMGTTRPWYEKSHDRFNSQTKLVISILIVGFLFLAMVATHH